MSGTENKKGLPTLGIMALLGLFMLIWPGASMYIAGKLVGVALLLVAAAVCWEWVKDKSTDPKALVKLAGAVVALIAGIWVLANTSGFERLVPKLIGIVMMIYSAIELYKAYTTTKNPVTMVLCGVALILGLLVFINPVGVTATAVRLIGVALIYTAVSGVVNELKLLK